MFSLDLIALGCLTCSTGAAGVDGVGATEDCFSSIEGELSGNAAVAIGVSFNGWLRCCLADFLFGLTTVVTTDGAAFTAGPD